MHSVAVLPRTLFLTLFALLLSLGIVGASPATAATKTQAQPPEPGPCIEGVLPSGALSMYCVPSSGWNGDLIVWGHGYIAFNEPLDFHHLEFGSIYLPEFVQQLGFAFATTSYRDNGLVILEGADDIRELVDGFAAFAGQEAERTYMTGASEGGIISTLLAEQSPERFDGVLAACGPIGNFRAQLNYFGDFRVLFDYFFPGILPGDAVEIPQEVIDNWYTVYVPQVEAALAADPVAAQELIRVSRAPTDPNDPSTIEETTLGVLWYNVFATNDAMEKLGGNPFDNRSRWYEGSSHDLLLNLSVQRFAADREALESLVPYETTGDITLPLVTLHTNGDEIIPFWHERLYNIRVEPTGEGQFTLFPTVRYGHCNFTEAEIILSFLTLIQQVTGQTPDVSGIIEPADLEQARQNFAQAQRALGD